MATSLSDDIAASSEEEALFIEIANEICRTNYSVYENKDAERSEDRIRYWYSPDYLGKFEKLQEFLETLAPLLNYPKSEVIKTLSEHLYSCCFLNIKSYSEQLREEDDPYETAPLLWIYNFIAAANRVVFDRWFQSAPPEDHTRYAFYYQNQDGIHFCKFYNLIVTVATRICDFNISELLKAFDQLETNLQFIAFDPDLILYMEALELRASDFLMRKQDTESLNVANLRVMHPRERWYTCTTACEYMLISRIISLRASLEGVLESFRDHLECHRYPFPEEMERVDIMYKCMLAELQSVHSDKPQDDFTTAYERASVRASIGYQWMKENFGTTNPEPGATVNQFEGPEAWNAICKQGKLPIDRHFFEMKDPLAFWLVFFAAVEMIIKATIKINWATGYSEHDEGCRVSDYFITDFTLRTIDNRCLETILVRSHAVPIFIQSFNDAAVMLQGKLYVFGHRPIDYLRALHNWVDIIETVFSGMFDGMADIHAFKTKLYNPSVEPDLQRYVVQSASSEYVDLFNKTKAQIDEEHRQARIGFVMNAQQTSELQVTNILEKDAGVNLKPTNKSAWF